MRDEDIEMEVRTPSPNDTIFVALGKDLKEGESVLMWALHNSGGRKICILHVHQPAQRIPFMGPKVSISKLGDHQVRAYHENERREMHKTLDEYIQTCARAGARPEKLYLEMDSIEKGIVQCVSEHSIKWLVMGAAANKSHSRRMTEPKSKKAKETTNAPLRANSVTEGNNNCDSSSSVSSHHSMGTSEIIEDSTSISLARTEGGENSSQLPTLKHKNEHPINFSAPHTARERNMKDELYDRLKQYVMEAESARQETSQESIRRRKAEKDVIDTIRRAKACESMLAGELKYRGEIEEALARDKEEVEKIKYQLDKVMKELEVALDQKYILDSQIMSSNQSVEKLEQEIYSTMELLEKYRNDRDELKVEHENALRVAEELREKQEETSSSSSASQYFYKFSFAEIEVATNSFDESLKIGEGRYGIIYKGLLRHTQVAIKMLQPNSLQGLLEFQREVTTLSKLRHPNLVTLVGICEEELALVYEYLPNGSLEDRLNCKHNTFPLSWETRIRIAAELCSAVIFLHSSHPRVLLHGVLHPTNILLDANFMPKLNDFGMPSEENSVTTLPTSLTDTFTYMDPDFLATGELTLKSDVYSFGIILLRLLTGRPVRGIRNEVLCALDEGNLRDLLDPTAGDWPFVQAKQLAHLAISCCETSSRRRPDLVSDVWRVLKPMGGSYIQLGSKEFCKIPSYFICPIFQEIMQNPMVAADGFTYESEALKGWLETGHDTSPMTNLKLQNCNLVPNHALRSTIQEWLQQT